MNNYDAAPAPILTKAGHCSDCGVSAIWTNGNELRVCPQCYALLWHIDYTTEREQQKELAAAAWREQNYARRDAYEAAREVAREVAREAVRVARLQAREAKDNKL